MQERMETCRQVDNHCLLPCMWTSKTDARFPLCDRMQMATTCFIQIKKKLGNFSQSSYARQSTSQALSSFNTWSIFRDKSSVFAIAFVTPPATDLLYYGTKKKKRILPRKLGIVESRVGRVFKPITMNVWNYVQWGVWFSAICPFDLCTSIGSEFHHA